MNNDTQKVSNEKLSKSTAPLTRQEKVRLSKLEQKIDSGLKTFLEVGRALKEINELKLYRELAVSFEKYVNQRFKIGRAYAYRLMHAAQLDETLEVSPIGDKPVNESQFRALAKVDGNKLCEVWEKAVETAHKSGKTVSAKLIKDTVQNRVELATEKADETEDEPVPEWFQCISKVDAFRSSINGLLKQINDVEESPGFELLARYRSRIRTDLENARNAILGCIPYDVCPYCNGMANDCDGCSDRGWLNKLQFNAAPEEMRNGVKRLSGGGNC